VKKMVNRTLGTELNVTEVIVLRNLWEYYVTDEETGNPDIKFCFVCGFENELGDVSMSEIAPYVLTRTKKLDQALPAPGYTWKEYT